MLIRAQIPNALTLFRMIAVLLILLVIMLHPPFAGLTLFVLFVLAAISDFLDGYLARKWNVISPMGALLDPIADKLLVTVVLLYLMAVKVSPFLPVTIILLRELYVSGLREFFAARQVTLPVSNGGKWKTALQMLAIALLLAVPMLGKLGGPLFIIGNYMLWAAALLAVISAVDYTRKALKQLR